MSVGRRQPPEGVHMNTTQDGIITLLKSAITQQSLPLPAGFDMEEAFPVIKRHHIVTLAYDGAVRCGIPRQAAKMQELFLSYCRGLQISERQMKELHRLFAAFEENKIDYLPLKGSKMKALYPKPELRVMGDADILIRFEQYDAIIPVMRQLGFIEKRANDHELVWETDALHLELHKLLIPSDVHDYYAYFRDGWHLAVPDAGTRYTMTKENEFLFLFTHFAKHFRGSGIGCRHVVDLWVYLRHYPDLDMAYVEAELKKLDLLEFYRNIRCLIMAWFEDGEYDRKTELISEYIFENGNWGSRENGVLSQALQDKDQTGLKRSYLRRKFFPGVRVLEEEYPVVKKQAWLIPLVWAIRPFHKVLSDPATVKRQQQNLEVLTSEKLDDRQKMLQEMGLQWRK